MFELIFDERSDDTARASAQTEHGLVVARVTGSRWSVTLYHADVTLSQSGHDADPRAAAEWAAEALVEMAREASRCDVEVLT